MRPILFTGFLLVWSACGVLSSNSTSEEERFLMGGENSYRRWPGAVIPYSIGVNHFSAAEKRVIMSAIEEFNTKTACISFVPKRSRDKSYVSFYKGSGCHSKVGRVHGGVRQDLSLGHGCVHKGTIVHEMMHAIGFFHEQSRSDRDNYVRINGRNILSGAHDQFEITARKWEPTDLGFGYDYDSIMHYRGNGFARRYDLKTIEAIRGNLQTRKRDQKRIDQNKDGLSRTDVKRLNKLCGFKSYCKDEYLNNWCALNVKSPRDRRCKSGDVRKYCKKTCNLCPTVTITTRTPRITTPKQVTTTEKPTTRQPTTVETRQNCKDTAFDNWCHKNLQSSSDPRCQSMKTVRRWCKKSCNICPVCTDNRTACPSWANRNLCTTGKYVAFMRKNCKKSCNLTC